MTEVRRLTEGPKEIGAKTVRCLGLLRPTFRVSKLRTNPDGAIPHIDRKVARVNRLQTIPGPTHTTLETQIQIDKQLRAFLTLLLGHRQH